MRNYEGPATLVVGDTEVEVEAHLADANGAGALRSWGGWLSSDDEQGLWEAYTAGQARVRLPDGREATLVVGDFGGGQANVTGSGPPPYGG